MGGGQNLERWNVEWPIFRNFKIANIKIFSSKTFLDLIFLFLEIIWTSKIFNNLSSYEILIFQMVELDFFIFQIVKFS